MPNAPRRRGFTLIELLVVVAVIAILAAVLFPVFNKVRENARRTTCLSNMKQINTALLQYENDHDNFTTPSQLTVGATVTCWPTTIYKYIQNGDVFVCPDGTDKEVLDPNLVATPLPTQTNSYCGVTSDDPSVADYGQEGDGSTADVRQVHALSYALNVIPDTLGSVANPTWKTPGFKTATNHKSGYVAGGTTVGINENQVADPSGTIRIVDAMTTASPGQMNAGKPIVSCGLGNSIRGIQAENRTDHFPDLTSSKVAMRHTGGFNALYGDGHVRYLKYGTTTACDWSVQEDRGQCPLPPQ